MQPEDQEKPEVEEEPEEKKGRFTLRRRLEKPAGPLPASNAPTVAQRSASERPFTLGEGTLHVTSVDGVRQYIGNTQPLSISIDMAHDSGAMAIGAYVDSHMSRVSRMSANIRASAGSAIQAFRGMADALTTLGGAPSAIADEVTVRANADTTQEIEFDTVNRHYHSGGFLTPAADQAETQLSRLNMPLLTTSEMARRLGMSELRRAPLSFNHDAVLAPETYVPQPFSAQSTNRENWSRAIQARLNQARLLYPGLDTAGVQPAALHAFLLHLEEAAVDAEVDVLQAYAARTPLGRMIYAITFQASQGLATLQARRTYGLMVYLTSTSFSVPDASEMLDSRYVAEDDLSTQTQLYGRVSSLIAGMVDRDMLAWRIKMLPS